MSEKIRTLSVVISAYNEEESLPILVDGSIHTLEENHLCGEIIMVDDGSTDGTRKISEEMFKRHIYVRVCARAEAKIKSSNFKINI